MRFTSLGRSGLKVSRLCLGTVNFGPRTSEEDSYRLMDRALELGINFFDTANLYGHPIEYGLTEKIIGRWLVKTGNRDHIVLATKLYGPMGSGANDEGLSAYHIRAACNASLERLQTDRIDLYQMHHIDRGKPHFRSDLKWLNGDRNRLSYPPHIKPGTPWEEIWQAFGQLIGAGKVIYVGSSNFAAWNIAQAIERSERLGMFGLVSEQSYYNLLKRDIELEVVPACREYGVGILPWSPLNGGDLAGDSLTNDNGRRSDREYDAETAEKRRLFLDFCNNLSEEPAIVALAWLLHNPVVTAPIIGPRTIAQLESSVRAVDLTLDESTLVRLDEIFPGPGDQAPEAYAW
jgi:aryl-alcohol dehydrogenase-like predicted oxidoreductase